jgi:RNA exonuclease 1
MEEARSQGTCIMGRDKARAAVWRYVGPQTVVVGYAAHNDLTALRWTHPTVVDTFLLEKKKATPQGEVASHPSEMGSTIGEKHRPRRQGRKEPGPLALQTLARLRLEREIQVSRKGHDSLEHTLATRDLAH